MPNTKKNKKREDNCGLTTLGNGPGKMKASPWKLFFQEQRLQPFQKQPTLYWQCVNVSLRDFTLHFAFLLIHSITVEMNIWLCIYDTYIQRYNYVCHKKIIRIWKYLDVENNLMEVMPPLSLIMSDNCCCCYDRWKYWRG